MPPYPATPAARSPNHLSAPAHLLLRWPAELPVAAARIGSATNRRWIFAHPRETLRISSQPDRRLMLRWMDAATAQPLDPGFALSGTCPIEILDQALASTRHPTSSGGWIGWLSYDLGAQLEPAARGTTPRDPHPLLELHRYTSAWVLDDATGTLTPLGNPPPLLAYPGIEKHTAPLEFSSVTGKARYTQAVARALEYIRSGDVYEVNLAHTLRARSVGCPRALVAALIHHADPARGAYLEPPPGLDIRAIASVSPELFIEFDASSRTLTTRPMKGTRKAQAGAEQELRNSDKEQAELHMITDLMRNDLGRVCALGSVRVEDPRLIETHAGGSLLQASARVVGTLRNDLSIAQALGRIFPAGSITGAPKIRAMQIIDELEDQPRGIWCGSIAHFADCGDAHLSVAIRTAIVRSNTVEYPVGAGIVADSVPDAEWAETLAKASVLRAVGTITDTP